MSRVFIFPIFVIIVALTVCSGSGGENAENGLQGARGGLEWSCPLSLASAISDGGDEDAHDALVVQSEGETRVTGAGDNGTGYDLFLVRHTNQETSDGQDSAGFASLMSSEYYYAPHMVFEYIEFPSESGDKETVKKHYYKATDTLRLTRMGRRTGFVINIYADNGHTCSMSNVAWEEDGYFRYSEPTGEAGDVCELRIVPKGDGFVLEDAGNNCRRLYCGSRAGIGGYFSRSQAYDCKRGFYFSVRREYAARSDAVNFHWEDPFGPWWMIPGMVFDGIKHPCSQLETIFADQSKYYPIFNGSPPLSLDACLEIEAISRDVINNLSCD
jgi:hypothetical protein